MPVDVSRRCQGQCRPSFLAALAALAAPRLHLPPPGGFPRPRAAMDVAARGPDQCQSLTTCALGRQCTALGLCPCHERSPPGLDPTPPARVRYRLPAVGGACSANGCAPAHCRAARARPLLRPSTITSLRTTGGMAVSGRCRGTQWSLPVASWDYQRVMAAISSGRDCTLPGRAFGHVAGGLDRPGPHRLALPCTLASWMAG